MRLLVLALLLSFGANAQTFEGTIRWSMKSEMDPAMKQKLQMTDEQKKEMKERMNDPNMKEMLEKNPQMKAQMEAAINGNSDDMMPHGMMVRVKGTSSLTKMEGGMMGNMEILSIGATGKSYRLDRDNKTYAELGGSTPHGNPALQMTVTKTGETTKILGYTCTRYDITDPQRGAGMTQTVWATNEIPGIDPKAFAHQRMGNGNSDFMEKIDGVPLKVEMKSPQVSMEMEAIEIKHESQNASDFVLPSDFKQVQIGMGMMGQ